MIEAFEIGIKLALQDGISSGIAAARRDLDALDRAIASTTIGLARLQRFGNEALSSVGKASMPAAARAVPDKSAPAKPPSDMIDDPSPPLARSDEIKRDQAWQPGPLIAAPAPTGLPISRKAGSAEPVITAPPTSRKAGSTEPVMSPVTVPASITAAAERSAAQDRPAAPVQSSPSDVVIAQGPVVPAGVVTFSKVSTPVEISAVLSAPQGPAGRPAPLDPLKTQPARNIRQDAAAPVTATDRIIHATPPRPIARLVQAQPEAPSGSSRPLRKLDSGRGATPNKKTPAAAPQTAALSPASDKFDQTSGAKPASAASYAPPGQGTRSRGEAIRGDVYLDGARMGRWMSDRLTREVGRPSAGPTGFDSKRSVAWPGAAVTS